MSVIEHRPYQFIFSSSPTTLPGYFTKLIVEIDLLRDRPGRNNRQDVRDEQVHLLACLGLAHGQADALARFGVAPPTVDKGWVVAVHVVVLAQEGEALADGVVPAVVGLEIGGELFFLGWAVLLSEDAALVEDDGLGPLS